jgi:membrane-bound lytic murein transglycosylase D
LVARPASAGSLFSPGNTDDGATVAGMDERNGPVERSGGKRHFPFLIQNRRVGDFVGRFLKGRGFFSNTLARSGRYLTMMKGIFQQHGMPEELVYISLIESGFQTHLRSSSMAVGPWQFLRGTANRYGLRTTRWVDERMDPVKSTEAAARYLKDLHQRFGQWHLAVAGYHAGRIKLERALVDSKAGDFWTLANTDHLNQATKNFVPKFIAAALIATSPARFGLKDIRYDPPLEFDRVTIHRSIDLQEVAELAGTTVETLRKLNPHLLLGSTPPDDPGFELRVPKGVGETIQEKLATRHADRH